MLSLRDSPLGGELLKATLEYGTATLQARHGTQLTNAADAVSLSDHVYGRDRDMARNWDMKRDSQPPASAAIVSVVAERADGA